MSQHDDVTMDDELIRQAMRRAGRKGGKRRVRKGFATMEPQRLSDLSAKGVRARRG